MKTTLMETGDFAYLAALEPVPEPVGGHCLTISTRWKSSRNPDEEQVRFRACLDEAGIHALLHLLERAMVTTPREEMRPREQF